MKLIMINLKTDILECVPYLVRCHLHENPNHPLNWSSVVGLFKKSKWSSNCFHDVHSFSTGYRQSVNHVKKVQGFKDMILYYLVSFSNSALLSSTYFQSLSLASSISNVTLLKSHF